jgi:TRAP-type mannitol/chloroaromatic compound transport system substrate-binding protein
MQTFQPAGVPEFAPAQHIADAINVMANGRLHIDLFPGGAIVPACEEYDGLRTGALDIAHYAMGFLNTLVPSAALFTQIPGGPTNNQYGLWHIGGEGDKLAQEAIDPLGVIFLGTGLQVPEDWALTTITLDTPSDLKKLKMRTFGDGGEVLARLGAATIFLPGGEIYESLQRGVINACEYGGATSDYEMGFGEVCKYLYISTSRAPTDSNMFIVRKERWAELPDDLKLIVKQAVRAEMYVYFAENLIRDTESLEKFKKDGVQILPLPKAIEDAFLAEAKKFYDEKLQKEGDLYKRALTSLRDFQKLCVSKGIY